MKHVTRILDLGPEGVEAVLAQAAAWKQQDPGAIFAGKLLGMVFFNPSLRTRTSFEAVMLRAGGHAIVLDVGSGVWKLEDRPGAVMNADRAEHIKEAAPVLSRFVNMLGVRTFSQGGGDAEDEVDPVINAFRKWATVPVVSMESAREHPCQGLADVLTLRETFGTTRKLPVTLTWAPHIKPLPKAVPNSFLLSAAAAGCEVRVAHPPGFELHPAVRAEAEAYAKATGGSITYTHDQEEALAGSRAVYAKSWGPSAESAFTPADVATLLASYSGWMPTRRHMAQAAKDAAFLHCLPVRRNVEVSDEVLDHPSSRVVDEAGNRYHVQRALLNWMRFA
ncbi:N-acetylornithine carbamoyltransferase [Corallococcus sp. H22C18031201]|uniref:N-acetylornithine carbamoyltransferase n=1 Tax=Citreicoccus inhibens TaxID=2849499 RepID=UPI000E73DCF1|nr:N-acetylornithine carbamoyltransferase [Citreicoccus inhibens]MBU8899768.1 N-acetylornithine carbamoyltransferase [Citreicoccus inhibens]RJS19172.1 N-acetylornithine carbamoyltransferase [Corallococcus sp. H22C18031201]